MHRFYAPDIECAMLLPEEEAQHCVRVLRLVPGDIIEVVDGKGNLFRCKIVEASKQKCEVEIVDRLTIPPHWNCNITIAIAPTKNADRLEWMVEKCVEMGVDRIVPILCRYSERKVLRVDRLQKIAVSAMKQSLKTTLEALVSTEFAHPSGSFISNHPKKDRAKTTSNRKRKMLNMEFVESSLSLLGPKMRVMMMPNAR